MLCHACYWRQYYRLELDHLACNLLYSLMGGLKTFVPWHLLCCFVLQSEILQMEPPELYVRQNPTPNAYTLAISGRKPFIVVHTSLLELLTPRELQAVLAHGRKDQRLAAWLVCSLPAFSCCVTTTLHSHARGIECCACCIKSCYC